MATKRKTKPKNEIQQLLKKIRKLLPTSVIEIELNTNGDHRKDIEQTLEHSRLIRNTVLGELEKRYKQMIRTKEHKELRELYALAVKNEDEEGIKELRKQFDQLNQRFQLTPECGAKEAAILQKRFSKAQAVIGLTTSDRVWQSIDGLLFGNSKAVLYKGKGKWNSFEGKQNEKCIMLKRDKEGVFYLSYLKKNIPLKIKEKDLFIQETLTNIAHYMDYSEEIDAKNVKRYQADQPLLDTYRVKYNRIVQKEIRGKYRYFVQIVLEGKPVPKRKKDGSFRHTLGKGRVGIDVGTQSAGIVTKEKVILKNLAERTNKKREKQMIRLQRKQNRSLRINNPEYYTYDGQIKKMEKGQKREWTRSKKYVKRQKKLRNLHRVLAENRTYAHNQDINEIRKLGDEVFVETNQVKAWQKKAKETKVSEKTGKYQRKKRFGKSILNRSPGYFMSQLQYRFELTGGSYHAINTWTFKASQYNHVLNDTNKKQLSQRWHIFEDGKKVQRDLYSAFLLYCSNENLEKPNQDLCMIHFDSFLANHHLCIETLKKNHIVVCNSGIKF